jgi:hypothetical protein
LTIGHPLIKGKRDKETYGNLRIFVTAQLDSESLKRDYGTYGNNGINGKEHLNSNTELS